MKSIESEVKFLIKRYDFNQLKKYLNEMNYFLYVKAHINYYIDSKDFCLNNNGISVRLRVNEENKYEFTIKTKLKISQEYIHIKNEFTEVISQDEYIYVLENNRLNLRLSNYLKSIIKSYTDSTINIEKLTIIGHLKTVRSYYQIDNKFVEFVLDESEYLGMKDYEVEIETEDTEYAKKYIINLCSDLAIEVLKENNSKTKRFIKRYKFMPKKILNID